MEDKEKQIEEMARIIGHCYCDKECQNKCAYCDISSLNEAKKLYENGFRKLPKDSIVLSREEKSKLVHIDTLKSIKSISQLRELLSNITTNNDLMGYNDRELEIRQEERKETAEKILIKGKQLVEKWLSRNDEKVGFLFDFEEFIKKQFGVEIKE